MSNKVNRVTLPSGKEVWRVFDEEDRVIVDGHAYGDDISLVRQTFHDQPIHESYRSHGVQVDRATYEMVRVNYPDMPPSDPDARDGRGELLKKAGVSEKVRQYHATLPHHPTQPDQRLTRKEHEKLPSGKLVMRDFQAGRLSGETHSYGAIDISISIAFLDGKRDETYFCKNRMVSRKTYEKARQKYPDMPPADASIEDTGAELLRVVRAERQHFLKDAKHHVPNLDAGRACDTFCVERMKTGRCADAVRWVRTKGNTLGEMTQVASRRLVDKLVKLGAVAVHACEIDSYEHGENTGHLVVELPASPAVRAAILKEVDRLAREQGYEGELDNGQRYAYVRLD